MELFYIAEILQRLETYLKIRKYILNYTHVMF